MRIGLIDSGVGGMSILHSLIQKFPDNSFVYLSDQKNFPYSEKSITQLQKIGEENVRHLAQLGCDVIIIACNTLTVTALSHLRQTFPDLPFIGTVPAVKPASKQLPIGSEVVVLATKNTAESQYLKDLVLPFQERTNFSCIGSTRLVESIENWDSGAIKTELEAIFPVVQRQHVSGVVLGCTHFVFIEKNIQALFDHQIKFFEPSDGIAKQLENYTKNASVAKEPTRLFFSSHDRTQPSLAVAAQFAFFTSMI